MSPSRLLAILHRSLGMPLLCVLLLCVLSPSANAATTLRVGINDLPLLAFFDDNGQAHGLVVELLDHIAGQEGWQIEYVPGSIGELQQLAAEGKIDLLVPIAYSEERAKRLDFSEQFVYLNWGVVIRPAGSKIETLFDLRGEKVAVVRGSVHTAGFVSQLEQFHIRTELVEFDNFRQVVAAVAAGQYPAGVCCNLSALSVEKEYGVQQTSIVFSPQHIGFAAGKGSQTHILAAIDRRMRAFKADPDSIYFRLLDKWIPHRHTHTGKFFFWGGILIVAVLVLGWFTFTLQRKIKKKIGELVAVNSELQQNREELHRLNQQFQTLLDGIPDHLMLIAPTLQIVWMNQAARRHAGERSLDPLLTCHDGWAQERVPCQTCPVQDCFATGLAQEAVIHLGERVFGVKAFPIRDEQGRVESVIKLAIDISDKIRLHEESNRQNRLAAVGTLAAGVAHEINNPAGLILSNLELVCEAFEDAAPILDAQLATHGDFSFGGLPFSRMREQLPALLKETGDAARRIRQTVEDLKDFAHGGGQHEVVEFLLRDAIERSIRLTDHLLHKATGHVTLHLAEEPILLLGNKRRIEQVLVNLLANACQALPDRNGAIHLTTRFDAARQIATISVRDEGVGIPAEHLPKLATPFFTTRQKEGGTGLGLSVSFGIVREHGGTIHFASEPGHGTTVTVALPASITEFAP